MVWECYLHLDPSEGSPVVGQIDIAVTQFRAGMSHEEDQLILNLY